MFTGNPYWSPGYYYHRSNGRQQAILRVKYGKDLPEMAPNCQIHEVEMGRALLEISGICC